MSSSSLKPSVPDGQGEEKKEVDGDDTKKEAKKKPKNQVSSKGTDFSMMDGGDLGDGKYNDGKGKGIKKGVPKEEELCSKQMTSGEVFDAYLTYGVHKEGVEAKDRKGGTATLWKVSVHVAFVELVTFV